MKKKALGRGLSALIPERAEEQGAQERIINLRIDEINPGKYQPRTDFNKKKLEDLINSIKENGIVQPILVRNTGSGYELIAGERRLRAAKMIGHETISAIVKNAEDADTLGMSLIENIQRENLNPIEEAGAYQRFIDEFDFTQEEVSRVLGKERSTIANTIRLLGLQKKVQEFIVSNSITAGHGKVLLQVPSEKEQLKVCNIVVKNGLSVRETEKLVAKRSRPPQEKAQSEDANVAAIEDELRGRFGTRVTISHGKKRGKIALEYYSIDDFERIVNMLRGRNDTPADPQ